MSSETLSILMTLDRNSVDTKLATQCAPVIAGVKVSNLLTVKREFLQDICQIFAGTPIRVFVLCWHKDKVSILLYRKELLQNYLKRGEVIDLLNAMGYEDCTLHKIFPVLQKRYKNHVLDNGEFPHELGLILGYPACDVSGFMNNKGRNFSYNGYWKVYENKDEAVKTFTKYDRVKEAAIRLLGRDRSVMELIKAG